MYRVSALNVLFYLYLSGYISYVMFLASILKVTRRIGLNQCNSKMYSSFLTVNDVIKRNYGKLCIYVKIKVYWNGIRSISFLICHCRKVVEYLK